MKIRACAALFVLVAPGYASAQSLSGFRVEAHTGVDRVETDVDDTGVLYGIGLGYDFAIGSSTFAGVEVNLDGTNAGRCESGRIIAGDLLCSESAQDISVLARLGTRVSDRGKIYAALGYSSFQVDVDYTAGGVTRSSDQTLEGIRAAVGYQHNLSERFYLKGEYRYTGYGSGERRHQGVVGFGISF
ncbi:MAG: porin family protein [Sphingosinicella sp.]|nr:porin family protein [Sphingosinicella sp.]